LQERIVSSHSVLPELIPGLLVFRFLLVIGLIVGFVSTRILLDALAAGLTIFLVLGLDCLALVTARPRFLRSFCCRISAFGAPLPLPLSCCAMASGADSISPTRSIIPKNNLLMISPCLISISDNSGTQLRPPDSPGMHAWPSRMRELQ
jgi:hypothetical protein